MTVKELNREQLIQLKQSYLDRLNDEGTLNEVLYDKPEWDKDGKHNLTMSDYANADNLISDEMVFEYHEGTDFTEDDFYTRDTSVKALTEYTDRELLKHFNERFVKYDSLKDEELDFLADHPNRDIWDDEQVSEYDGICEEIKAEYAEIVKISQFIKDLR